ncbi:MAG: N-acetylmuramoyl-L-alanine amidase [Candidatus Cryptobacteroides sp.]
MKRITVLLFSLFLLSPRVFASDELSLKTVVLDPGHGGKDPGAVSKDGKTLEKTFTLDIALKLEKLIKQAHPEVKVILTRRDDRFISLDERAQIANRNNADLFISIHINSAYSTKSSGFSTHVLGQSSQKDRDLYKANLELVKRENSVVLLDESYNAQQSSFDPDDPSSYIFMTMMQSAHLEQSIQFAQLINSQLKGGPIAVNRGVSQDPFYVLWKTTMPAVLVELGFISNPEDLTKLKKSSEREELAKRLLKAFEEYKQEYDSSMSLDSAVKPETVKAETKARYGIQIFSLKSLLPENDSRLLGYKPYVQKSGKYYKYVISISDSQEELKKKLPEIRKKYPDAFMVKIEGENLIRCK